MNTKRWMLSFLLSLVLGSGQSVSAQTYTFSTLYSFPGTAGSPQGPEAPIIDSSGNVYGVSLGGKYEFGTVFKVTPKGVLTVLHDFGGTASDGKDPVTIIRNSTGTIFGITSFGGANNQGNIFKLAPNGTETILYSFTTENVLPLSLLLASTGDLYGYHVDNDSNFNVGSVFKLTHGGVFSHIYTFCSLSNCADGSLPWGPLILKGGNLYGATEYGGVQAPNDLGLGVVFELTPGGQETVLHEFTGSPNDGDLPMAKVTQDSAGNLYGTTEYGGTQDQGTIYKIDTSGVESILYNFCSLANCADGGLPISPVVVDAEGNLFGTTWHGGSSNDGGTVYRLSPAGVFTVLHDAVSGKAGVGSKLVMSASGSLYGMTYFGGTNHTGAIYKLTKHP
jgi:uncharacterized repeat protein (TIGR03803 family)